MDNNKNTVQYKPAFQSYMKFKSSKKNITLVQELVENNKNNYIFVNHKEGKNRDSIELLTGPHFDKLMKLLKTNSYLELRTKLPNYLRERPKSMSAKKYINKLDKKG